MSYTGRFRISIDITESVVFTDRVPSVVSLGPGEARVRGEIVPSTRSRGRSQDGMPRDTQSPSTLRYAAKALGVDAYELLPGSRVRPTDFAAGTTEPLYEVLGSPRPMQMNRRTYAYEVPVMEIARLYPYRGNLFKLGHTEIPEDIISEVEIALSEGSESSKGRGQYDEVEAEAPVSFWEALKPVNRLLMISGREYKIVSAQIMAEQPHVKLSLRAKDA